VEEALVFLSFLAAGLVGAVTNIALHGYRDGRLTGTKVQYACWLFLGLVAGFVAHQLYTHYGVPNHLMAWALGFVFPDVVETVARKYAPKVEEG